MADSEGLLISKCVSHGGIENLISRGITSEHFLDNENKEIWDYLTKHVKVYRTPPSIDTIREEFPSYVWQNSVEPLDYLTDEFVVLIKKRETTKSLRKLMKVIDENDKEQLNVVDETFLEEAKRLSELLPTTRVGNFTQMEKRVDTYKARKAEGKRRGMLYGLDEIDNDTLGLMPHQYVTIAGWTGIGKSTLGMIFSVQHFGDGFTPMIISAEMDEEEIFAKLDSIAVGLRQHALKELTLPGADVKRWEAFAERVTDAPNDIIVIDVDFPTAERIYAETTKWNPDVVVVDYIQLLEGPKDIGQRWERIDYNSRALKAQARSLRIPVYGLSQTNAEGESEGAKLSNLGGAKAIGFHSDLMLGMFQDENMAAMNKMDISVEKNRNGPKGAIQSMYWDQTKSDFRPWKISDAYPKDEV